jgi:hypothetical protein
MDKIKLYLSTHYKGILTFISLICITLLMIVLFAKPSVIPKSTQYTIDSLKQEVVALKKQIPIYNTKIIGFNSRIDSLGSVVTNNNNKSQALKLEYDKKINNINNFNTGDVYSYLINRYSTDTTKIK